MQIYQFPPRDPKMHGFTADLGFWAGKGNIDLQIKSIRIEFPSPWAGTSDLAQIQIAWVE